MKAALALLAPLLALCAPLAHPQAPDFTALVREAGSAVVRVTGSARPVLPDLPLADDLPDDDPGERLRRDYGLRPEPQSLGSGFVIDASGYIVTNAHLVSHTQDIVVRLADRRELDARLVGYDPASDVALLKIEARDLAAVRIGDPLALRAGEWVAAIGAPFGFERSVTAGIVSAVGRVIPENSFVAFIQTDVAVNPGNSGGPLLNLRGEVVGVNSGFYSETGGYSGVSFAIPIDLAMEVAAQLRTRGKVTRGVIGVRLQEMSTELARAFRLAQPAAGALVLEVFRGGPAERAAVRPGDVIMRFDGKPVENDAALVRLSAAASPGKTVEVELVRFGALLTARVLVGEARTPPMPVARGVESEPLGLQLVPLGARLRERLRIDGGLMVERPGGAGERAGLARGDLILSVNGAAVATLQEFQRLLERAGKGATVALLVQREGIRQFLPLRVPR
jgi:serine protease Do